jgi:aspartate dehydrogenase
VDAIKAASIGKIYEVELITRKPPSRFISDKLPAGIEINPNMKQPTVIFKGDAKTAQNFFPRSINVAATLSLASLGPELTKVTIIADPSIEENIHEIHVKGEFGTLKTYVENLPSIKNPKTSYLAALSAIKTLKKISEHIEIGT